MPGGPSFPARRVFSSIRSSASFTEPQAPDFKEGRDSGIYRARGIYWGSSIEGAGDLVSRSPRAPQDTLLQHQEYENFTLSGAERLQRLADQGTRAVQRNATHLDRHRAHRVSRRGARHQQIARSDRPEAGVDLHLDP